MATTRKSSLASLAVVHGIYFLITGIWPLLHIQSFLAVTGPKEEVWLVKTVGVIILVMGAGLTAAGIQRKVNLPILIIAVAGALGFIMIDVIYVLKDVIPLVYLLDAGIEFVFLVLWVVFLSRASLD